MNIKICILIVFTFFMGNIYSQHLNNMKKFDLELFNSQEKDINGAYSYELNDSTIISLEDWGDSFVERQIRKGTNLEKRYDYYKSGKIKLSANLFCDVLIDTTRWYNEYGEPVNEIDEDAPYLFCMDDLRETIKKMFDIDILYPKRQLSIIRSKNEPILNIFPQVEYLYEVFIPIKSGVRKYGHELIIDGTTGQILSHIDENGNELASKYKKDTSMNTLRNWTPLMDDEV